MSIIHKISTLPSFFLPKKYPIRKKLDPIQKKGIEEYNKQIESNVLESTKDNCPLCKSSKSFSLFKNDRHGLKCQTVLCLDCGLVYQNPRLTEKSLLRFYETGLFRDIYVGQKKTNYNSRYEFDFNYHFDTNEYKASESLYYFSKTCKINYNSVCEIGAGGGWNLVPFIKENKNVIGYEPDSNLVKLGNENNIPLKQGFISDINQPFDLFIMRHVLEHLKNPEAEILQLKSYINKYLLIEVPGFIRKIPSIQTAHLSYFSIDTLNSLMAKQGFKILKAAVFKPNNYIICLYEKVISSSYNYNKNREVFRILKIYYKNQMRQKLSFIKRIL